MKIFKHLAGVEGFYCLKKPLIIMKLTLGLILVFNLQILANGYSQTRVSLNLKSADFKKVISEIERKTSYHFIFSERKIPVKQYTNINVADVDVLTLVGRLLDGTLFTYQKLPNNLIAIVPNGTVVRDVKVTGKVLDETGQPLIGASVRIKGLKGGASTDSKGAFTLSVPDNAILIVSFLDYITQEVPVNGQTSITVKLQPSEKSLNEVVVVGYGTQKKSDVTGSIASVDASAIAKAATTDATGALQGRMPGVVVVKNVARPGAGYSINIRGTHSIGGSNSPLFVIDGIPTTSGLNDLNPTDIDKIDVLKDASATAIYGSRGANGVVIVTTKRGKAGKTSISYDAYAGVKVASNLPEMFNGAEFVQFRTDMFTAQGKDVSRNNTSFFSPAQWKNIDEGRYTDWIDLILKNALQMNHNVTASGGDDKTLFAISAGMLREDGNIEGQNFNRYSIRGNVDRKINDKWKAGLNLYLSQNIANEGSFEALRSAYRLPQAVYPYDENGAPVFKVYGGNSVTNPLFEAENEIRRKRNFRAFGNIYVQVEPIKDLLIKSTISPSYVGIRQGEYYGSQSKDRQGSLPIRAVNASNEQFIWVLDNQISYEKLMGKHKFAGTLVQSMQKDRYETSTLEAEGMPYKSLWYNMATGSTVRNYGSSFIKSTLVSGMGRLNYSYDDRYLVTATGRWDGSSRLAAGNQWGFFPSASIAWRITQEDFMKDLTAFNNLKLRLSYGITGNDRVDAYSTQATLGQTFYDFGGTIASGYAPNQLANKNLSWEKTKELNLGLDFGILKDRISGSVDVYDRLIENILMNRQLPVPSGWSFITDNIGKLKNKGVELGLNTINVQSDKFSWRTDIVYDVNKNEILELYGAKKDDIGSSLFIGEPVQVNYNYVFDGIWQLGEEAQAAKYSQKPGQIRVKDLNNDGIINGSDKQIIGKRIPRWTGSIGNTFKYGNVDLYVMAYTRQGEQFVSSFDATFMNYTQDYNQVKVDYWTPSNPSQTYFQPGNPGPYANIPTYRDVSFVRIANITLGYNLPKTLLTKINVKNLRVYATATNPFTFTKYEGFDPEWAINNSFGTAVSPTAYLFGINLGF